MERYPWWMQPAGTIEKVFVFILFVVVVAIITIVVV